MYYGAFFVRYITLGVGDKMNDNDGYDLLGFWYLQIGLDLCGVQSASKASEILCVPLQKYVNIRRELIVFSIDVIHKRLLIFCPNCNKSVCTNEQNQCKECNFDIEVNENETHR